MAKSDLTPEDRERAGRKALPKTMRAWITEMDGAIEFSTKRVHLRDANGKAWLLSMQLYYVSRVKLLAENPPDILPKVAAGAIVREVLKRLA